MNRYEQDLRPLLSRMINGEICVLTTERRLKLTEYLAYKALVIDQLDRKPVMPSEVATAFYETRKLPPNLSINLFNCFVGRWRSALRSEAMSLVHAEDYVFPDEALNTKSISIGFGNLFVFLYLATSVDYNPVFDERLAVRLYPGPQADEVVSWPPQQPIASDQAEFVANTLRRIGGEDGLNLIVAQ